MVTIYATESNPFKRTGASMECSEELAKTLISKGFAVASEKEPKQPSAPKEPKQPIKPKTK